MVLVYILEMTLCIVFSLKCVERAKNRYLKANYVIVVIQINFENLYRRVTLCWHHNLTCYMEFSHVVLSNNYINSLRCVEFPLNEVYVTGEPTLLEYAYGLFSIYSKRR